MQCTFSAESVVLTLSNWASHSEICELHILVRVDKTVSARHVSATKSIRVMDCSPNSTCGHIWGRWGRRGRWPHPPPWRSAACWRPRQTRPCSAPWPGAASPANIYQWQCEDMRRYLPWALGKCVDKLRFEISVEHELHDGEDWLTPRADSQQPHDVLVGESWNSS